MTNREMRFFNVAREVSLLSNFKGPHIGAVVVEGNRILSTAYNSNKTHPLQHRYNIYRHFETYDHSQPKSHAEIAALSPLIGKEINWNRVSIFVYREDQHGNRLCCKPCEACSRLINDLGIKNIFYINKFGNYVKEKVLQEAYELFRNCF